VACHSHSLARGRCLELYIRHIVFFVVALNCGTTSNLIVRQAAFQRTIKYEYQCTWKCFVVVVVRHNEKFGEKMAFLTQNKGKLSKNLIITLVFEENVNFFAENCQKSKKIVIITSSPGRIYFCMYSSKGHAFTFFLRSNDI
jgi:hypothetical protein